MLNLFQLKPGSDEAFARWMTTATPFLSAHGAQVLYAGSIAELLVGDVGGTWDRMVLIQYPTRQAVLDLAADPAFREAVPQRDAIVAAQVLYATDPSGD